MLHQWRELIFELEQEKEISKVNMESNKLQMDNVKFEKESGNVEMESDKLDMSCAKVQMDTSKEEVDHKASLWTIKLSSLIWKLMMRDVGFRMVWTCEAIHRCKMTT